MENELRNLGTVITTIVASLTYCYFISSRVQKGRLRLLTLFPVILIFIFLPLLLSSVALQVTVGILIAWLANFKLLFFALGKDPLSFPRYDSLSLIHFITITSLPIRIKQPHFQPQTTAKHLNSSQIFVVNALLWFILIRFYDYKDSMHPMVTRTVYVLRSSLTIQLIFVSGAALAWVILGQELEPQFNNPHLSTSLQEFWGKRWNRVVSSTLKESIYTPLRSLLTPLLGRKCALHLAIFCTFGVSGLLHELLYFYVTRVQSTWEVFCFFIIQGICLSIEVEVKKSLKDKLNLNPRVSVCLAVGFVTSTNVWLGFIHLINCGADIREINEYRALVEYAKHVFRGTRICTQGMVCQKIG